MNTQGTNGHSVTDVLPGLLKRRNQVGAESVEGRLISTLIQQVKNYQSEEDPTAKARLEWLMGLTMTKIDDLQRTA
jgi:hypothetical protein